MQNAWSKFVNDKNGKPVTWQRPNLAIILWFGSGLVGRFVHASPWHAILSIISTMSLVIWAFLEIFWGASYFRRALGGLVLLYTVLSRILG